MDFDENIPNHMKSTVMVQLGIDWQISYVLHSDTSINGWDNLEDLSKDANVTWAPLFLVTNPAPTPNLCVQLVSRVKF
jgi:hypothetical protein